eukprot:TRINITY_DN4345_c0_g1_i1.p2 TRINITY_DN4345_c0_g1~~TRINITY_DN4345_c0_g1_i1.p2  ORF type:complete len:79 (-),score=6.84 TRINITY_DN4345_c0_g1_i1:205-441(-)
MQTLRNNQEIIQQFPVPLAGYMKSQKCESPHKFSPSNVPFQHNSVQYEANGMMAQGHGFGNASAQTQSADKSFLQVCV